MRLIVELLAATQKFAPEEVRHLWKMSYSIARFVVQSLFSFAVYPSHTNTIVGWSLVFDTLLKADKISGKK